MSHLPISSGRSPSADNICDAVPPVVRFPPALAREAWFFLGRLAVGYGILLLLWLPFGASYRQGMIATGNAVFALGGENHSVMFQRFTQAKEMGLSDRVDAVVLVGRPEWRDKQGRKQQVLAKSIVTFSQPYAATAFLLALFGSTRLAWKVRLRRGALALGLLYLLMYGCVGIDVIFAFATSAPGPSVLPRWLLEVLSVLHVSITDWPAGVFIVPLLLWLLSCWPRRQNENRR